IVPSFLATSSRSVITRPQRTQRGFTIAVEKWLNIEILVTLPHLERHAAGRIAVDEQPPISEHTVHQVGGSMIEDDDIDGLTEYHRQCIDEVDRKRIDRSRRRDIEEHAEIHIAHLAGSSPCLTPEQIERGH